MNPGVASVNTTEEYKPELVFTMYLVGPEKHLIHYNSRLIVKYIWPVSTKNDKFNSRYPVEIEVRIATIEPIKLFPDQLFQYR